MKNPSPVALPAARRGSKRSAPASPPAAHCVEEGGRRLLGSVFAPRNIAVIGASEQPGSVGRALLENLLEYDGRVFPVNPRHPTLLGHRAYPEVGNIPEKIDLAVIATPAATVPKIVQGCVQAGVRAAIVHSAGFRECGPAGAALEREIVAEARKGGLRVIGPNCLGLMMPHRRLNATFAPSLARPGSVAFVSQSGALCSAVLDWSLREKVGFSAFISIGAMADVGWGELITCLGDDPHTRSIILYMESVGEARAFLSAAREVAFTKPIIAVKVGRTEPAARAAASHTGAMTGSDAVIDAAFHRVGVLRVDTIEDLFDMAEVLGKQPHPRGPRLGIVTNAGGPAALAVDRLVASGGVLAALDPATITRMDGVLPAQWSHANPVDILGDADATRYARAIEHVANDPETDGVLVVLTPQAMTEPLAVAQAMKSMPIPRDKPVLASWMGGESVARGEALLNEASIPTFAYPDRAAQAFHSMWRYSANLGALYETPALPISGATGRSETEDASAMIRSVRATGRVLLTEDEAKTVLRAYGIPVVPTSAAKSVDMAVDAAAKLGFPVAVKLRSLTVTHKSDVGGVVLDVRNADEVRKAWQAIEASVTAKAGAESFQGVTVQPMVGRDGIELILGSSVDPQFGPVLVFGAGGKWVEALQDRAIGLPPLTSTLAHRLMEQTRVHRALQATRGAPAVDLSALAAILVRFSQLVAEQRWVKEIDVNPLLASAPGITALDARMILHGRDVAEDQLPALAIRPYPQHYQRTVTLPDGGVLTFRPIRAEDEPMMVRFHETLSDQSVYFRYFTPLTLRQRTNHRRLAHLCFIDYDREMALVAVHEDPGSRQASVVGVARLCKAHANAAAEFAIIIADPWQKRGVGTRLLRRLVEVGRQEGVALIRGTILAENHAMRRLCEKAGFTVRRATGEQEFEAAIRP